MNHPYKGLFVTFEGIDFNGKTTQLKLLGNHIKSLGANVILSKEPGGTLIGDEIRRLLLDKKYDGMYRETELMLFNASRSQLVGEVLIPALKRGDVFLSDRFYDSTTAYQGYGRGLSLEGIKVITNIISRGVVPDITFLFDITVDESYKRRLTSLVIDRIESSEYGFYERVRNGYLSMAKQEPERIKVIDGMRTIEEIHEEVKGYFDGLFVSKYHTNENSFD